MPQETDVYAILKEAGIPQKGNERLYEKAIEQIQYADKLPLLIILLSKANIPFKGNEKFYQEAIVVFDAFEKLPVAFKILKENHIPFNPENRAIYLTVIQWAPYVDKLPELFTILKKAGIKYPIHATLYCEAIRNRFFDKLIQSLSILFQNHITFRTNPEYYTAIIEESKFADKLAQGFVALQQAGIKLQKDSMLYDGIIKNAHKADKLSELFRILKEVGITINHTQCIARIDFTKERIPVLNDLKRLGLNYQDHPKYFHPNLQYLNAKLAHFALNTLIQTGYNFTNHGPFFDRILALLSEREVNYQSITHIVNAACEYSTIHNVEKDLDTPAIEHINRDLMNIIESATHPYDTLTFGPLNQSPGTQKIEQILEEISTLESIDFAFIPPDDYLITLPQQGIINLSLLIKNANLSQLDLSDDLINKLGSKLEQIMTVERPDGNQLDTPVARVLSAAHQLALALYVGPYYYRNINRLFRAEPLLSNQSTQICTNDENNDRLAYFIVGCLVNDAANKIPSVIANLPEVILLTKLSNHYSTKEHRTIELRKYLIKPELFDSFLQQALTDTLITLQEYNMLQQNRERLLFFYPSKDYRLDRGEFIDEKIINRRLANPWILPAVTSFSSAKEGNKKFHECNEIRTLLENPLYRYIITTKEDEVIHPQGTQIITNKQEREGETVLISSVVRSPTLEPLDHYWSDLALIHAFTQHLSKPYSIEKASIVLHDVRIERPNHGLAHTYRVVLAIELVVHYFAQHAKDPEFQKFCLSLIDSEALEWLRVAAVFSITGRESEIAARENLPLYDSYRAACAQHFNEFMDKTAPKESREIQEQMSFVIRYMGNPDYEQSINTNADETERTRRNYYHRILSFAHKLDLPRCYDADTYQQSLRSYEGLSQDSAAQKQSLTEMMRYMIELNKAHGNRLYCGIQPNGELIDVHIDYQKPFEEVSLSWKRLFEVSDAVPRPKKILSFQYKPNLDSVDESSQEEPGINSVHPTQSKPTIAPEREDIVFIRNQIKRLRANSKQWHTYFGYDFNNSSKAQAIETALEQALERGVVDVRKDEGVQKAMAIHRILGFFGLKKTQSIINNEESLKNTPKK